MKILNESASGENVRVIVFNIESYKEEKIAKYFQKRSLNT